MLSCVLLDFSLVARGEKMKFAKMVPYNVVIKATAIAGPRADGSLNWLSIRSEERRVGKECGS